MLQQFDKSKDFFIGLVTISEKPYEARA